MVEHMVLLDLFPDSALEIGMVDSIVCHIIKKIADNESGEKGRELVRAEKNRKEQIQDHRHGNTGGWWHDQAQTVTRVIMMHPVENKMNTFHEYSFRRKMEDKAVQQVFR